MKKLLIILIVSTPAICYSSEWTKEDSLVQALYATYHMADWNQTLQINDNNDYEEINIILGKNPSDDQVNLYFASTLLAHYYAARKLKQPYRAYWQMLSLSLEYDMVRMNKRNGFKINWRF